MNLFQSRTVQLGLALGFILSTSYLAAEDKELPRNLQKGSTIIGDKVVNDQGQSLGKVEDIVIDPETGSIVYAVLSFGGFLGIGDKYFAIPWGALRTQPGKENLVLSVDKERLKKAPGFDKNHWPDMNPTWAGQVNEFYGVTPAIGTASAVRVYEFDFGEKGLRREAISLPLRLEQGKSFHYVMEMKPYAQRRGGFSSPDNERTTKGSICKHDAWVKVTKSSADASTGSFTFDATNCEFCQQAAKQAGQEAPGKGTYTFQTNQKGDVTSLQPENTGAANAHLASMEPMLKLQLRQLLGNGLHDQRLEPGKTYDAAWMHFDEWQKAKEAMMGGKKTAGAQPSSPTAGRETPDHPEMKNFALRYDGITETDGEKVALFTGASEGSSKTLRPTTDRPNPDQVGREERTFDVGTTTGRQTIYCQSNFRLEDGLLERFALVMPASCMNPERAADTATDRTTDKNDPKIAGSDGLVQLTIKRVD